MDDDDFRAGEPVPPEFRDAAFRLIVRALVVAALVAGFVCMWMHW